MTIKEIKKQSLFTVMYEVLILISKTKSTLVGWEIMQLILLLEYQTLSLLKVARRKKLVKKTSQENDEL